APKNVLAYQVVNCITPCAFAVLICFQCHSVRLGLHSFPTRRSSDLIYDRFTSELAKRTQALRVGHALRPETQIGPVSEAPQLERSEEHTSELQSRENLVCRLRLEKKNC